MPKTTVDSHSERSTLVPGGHQFTRDEYFEMADAGILSPDDSVELIEGHIVEMSPENSPHRGAVVKTSRAFGLELRVGA
ncbi:MAG: hypothetical protein ABEL04_08515 [Salinibacter sp.]|uniref:hypothetical protein n=1 Tax=Salinibacter sp. TaxID=2065818 RepID=UPI0035D4867F